MAKYLEIAPPIIQLPCSTRKSSRDFLAFSVIALMFRRIGEWLMLMFIMLRASLQLHQLSSVYVGWMKYQSI